jgi:2,4-dienoyl-CoA reductase (NADPH2)
VAIIGAGGIGFDVAEYLAHANGAPAVEGFAREWGIDTNLSARGGVQGMKPSAAQSPREITLLQRKTSKPGKDLGKTTGWIHRLSIRARGVTAMSGVRYERIDDAGLHITVAGAPRLLAVDHVVICAGQEPLRTLVPALQAAGVGHSVIGGAHEARELDAKRAIDQASRLAAEL